MSSKRDYYEVLGVGRSASAEEIRKAHRHPERKYHPGMNSDLHYTTIWNSSLRKVTSKNATAKRPDVARIVRPGPKKFGRACREHEDA